jgi:hypothetical protein
MFYGKEGSSDLLVRVLHYSEPSGLLPWQIRSSLTVLTVVQYTSGYNKNFRNFFKLPGKTRLKEATSTSKRWHKITTSRQLYCSANQSQKGLLKIIHHYVNNRFIIKYLR